ncbi:phage tail tape measure protein, TP901 family, core region [Fulvimarina manganoxydans]|uniref:Phage tail tape measure protein, TP901 family, core region n=1 Tax=Fulvimarina manganoxydans TaxID=937218 RepID=A0A1W1ZU85_9HYPH|nr:phage tail tape measure protein [Fulvimarina manganoxydans]SMC51648.1 phage tail tape measure protein, TP901 family, core region [Fulvimarina manganoxydans]
MAEKSAELILRLIDQVTSPAKAIKGELHDLDRLASGFRRGGGVQLMTAPQARGLRAFSAGQAAAGAQTRQVAASLAAQERAAASASAGMLAYARGMAPIAIPAAAALGVKSAITQAADFESALTKIQQKAGLSDEATAKLGEEIKALAVSGDVAVGIDEIAAAYERAAAAGVKIENLKAAATLSVKGADAFGMAAEEVGNFVAKLQTALGMTEQQVRQTLDLTNALADAGIADEKDLVNFMDRTGATLKTLGMTKEETLALGATLLNIGMPAEVASTGMGALAGKLLTVGELTGKNRTAFEKVMGPVGDFAELVDKDANSALMKMLDTLQTLDKSDRAAFLKAFVGQEWADEMIRLVEATGELRRNLGLARNEASWLDSLDRTYKLKLDDFWSQWQVMKNALAELAIDAGTMGLPAAQAALRGVRTLIDEIGKGLDAFELRLDVKGLAEAKQAVTDLMGAITGLLGMGGEGTILEQTFTRLADLINTVSSTIETAQEVLQALGMVEDKTPEKGVGDAVNKTIDGLAGVSPAGKALAGVRDVVTGRRTEEEDQTIRDDTARRRERMAAVGGQSVEDLDRARREHWQRRNARLGENAVVPMAGTMKLPKLELPTSAPADLVKSIPVPRSRPAKPVAAAVPAPTPIEVPMVPKIDEAAAAAAAAAIGQALSTMSTKASEAATMMKGLLGFATGPTVDTTSIDAATGKATVAGPAMKAALDVAATVQVNSGQIDNALGKANALRQALAGLGAATGGLRSGGAGKPSSAGSAIGAMVPPVDGARASGGPVRPGNWLVGEKGPEILQLFGRGYVHNAKDSRAILQSPKYHDPMTAFMREPHDGASSGRGGPSLAGAIGNTHNTTNHWNPTFNIRSTDPKGAADEVSRALLRANRRSQSTELNGRIASWES